MVDNPFPCRSPIPRRRFDDADVPGFLSRGEPVILEGGCPLSSQLVGSWSFAKLQKLFDGSEQLQVHYAPAGCRQHARYYGEGLGAGGVRSLSFARFVECADAEADGPWRNYLAAPLMWCNGLPPAGEPDCDGLDDDVGTGGGGECGPPPGADLRFYGEALESELRSRVGWPWLARASAHANDDGTGKPLAFESCQLWAGRGGGCTPLHFDALHNFLCQLSGRKHVVLFAPSQAHHLYVYPVGHPMADFSMVDLSPFRLAGRGADGGGRATPADGEAAAAQLRRFPSMRRAVALEATLEPGDVLWLPRFWFHFVEALDAGAENLSLNFWFGKTGRAQFVRELRSGGGMRDGGELTPEDREAAAAAAAAAASDADDAAATRAADDELLGARDSSMGLRCFRVARLFEGSTQELLGSAAAAGKLLTAMARGEDAAWAEGLPLKRHAARIRCEMGALLGAERANALLRGMAQDGRLHPGIAPPVVGDMVNSERGQLTLEGDVPRSLRATA